MRVIFEELILDMVAVAYLVLNGLQGDAPLSVQADTSAHVLITAV